MKSPFFPPPIEVDLRSPFFRHGPKGVFSRSGLVRLKCKSRLDGAIGWVTQIGNAGTVFLEVERDVERDVDVGQNGRPRGPQMLV